MTTQEIQNMADEHATPDEQALFKIAPFLIGIRVKPRLLGRGRIARAPQASLF
jgi:hypothetical protein